MQSEAGDKTNKFAITMGLTIMLLGLAAASYFLFFRHHNNLLLTVSEDATVKSLNPDSVIATKSLEVSNVDAACSTTTNCATYTSHIYLKFNVDHLPADKKVGSATLRLNATNLAGDGGEVYLTKSNQWNKNSITWSNAPAPQGRAIGSVGPVLQYGQHDISLPPDIIKSNGVLSLVITSNDRNIVAYKSIEAGDGKPQLLIDFNDKKAVAQPQKSYEVLAGGDISCGSTTQKVDSGDCKQNETAKIIGQAKPDAVLVLGDTQYEYGNLSDFEEFFNPSWGQYKPILRPAIGNHEYGNSYDHKSDGCTTASSNSPFAYACGYFDYFNGKNNLSGQAGDRGKGYYAFSLGNWRIYAINSNCNVVGCQAGSTQENWLRTDLAKHADSCKLMYMHHPISSSDTRNFDAYLEGIPDPINYAFISLNQSGLSDLYQAFYDYGGDLTLAGHSHFYERFAPQNIDRKQDKNGFTEIVVGTGGRYTYDVDSKHMRPLSLVNSTKGTHGLLALSLSASSYSWNYMPTPDSSFTDQGASTCHSAK